MLIVKYNDECNKVFGDRKVFCPLCNQDNEIYLIRPTDGKIFCEECYVAFSQGRVEVYEQIRSHIHEDRSMLKAFMETLNNPGSVSESLYRALAVWTARQADLLSLCEKMIPAREKRKK